MNNRSKKLVALCKSNNKSNNANPQTIQSLNVINESKIVHLENNIQVSSSQNFIMKKFLNDVITVPKSIDIDYQNYSNNITSYNDQDLNILESTDINTQSVTGPSQIDLPNNNLTENNNKETDTLINSNTPGSNYNTRFQLNKQYSTDQNVHNNKILLDSSDECDDSGDEWQPYNNKNNAIDSDSDGVIGTCNDENIFGVINVTENTENKKTGEQNIIKSVINYIIDEICNQSKDTLLEALDETVNSQSKKLVRRVRGDASKWKKNVISKEKKKLKKPKAIDCSHCKFKCSINFDESYRNEVCNKFWALDYNRQKDFILANVNIKSVKRHVPITNIRKAKENSKVYNKAFEGLGTDTGLFMDHDKRGKAPSVNKSSDEIIANINSHIEKFPTVESHYCRSTSKRQYLDPNLSISKMYELYVKECNETGQKQKDQCLTCEKYNKSAKPQSKDMVINYENHIRRRDESFAAKKLDKERATSDQSFCSATFDLQSVL
ncbi:GATA zinc finger domain-containing protein 4-like [Metopolophium dirhodum]|uniref:GATA zinc finger domain-containing protein 4-like n=1 Tax=Metopolophium dirhodum TaxID=44670 RepID=UPI00298F96C0|nr:GATA zinc finger domain-containing protein 4-like [Metopolophium dirhodum]